MGEDCNRERKKDITSAPAQINNYMSFCSAEKITASKHGCWKLLMWNPLNFDREIWFDFFEHSCYISNRFLASPIICVTRRSKENYRVTRFDTPAEKHSRNACRVIANR